VLCAGVRHRVELPRCHFVEAIDHADAASRAAVERVKSVPPVGPRQRATTFSRRRAFLLCETRRFRVAPSDPCSIGIRPRPADAAVCHSGGVNAQAPTSHLQPRPSPSTHLARPQRNGPQLSILLRRNRARPGFDTASAALARHAALRELRTHRAIHSRRRVSSTARRFAHRGMPPRSRPHEFLDLPCEQRFHEWPDS